VSPRKGAEAGTGLVDVVVATGLLSVLVAATAGLLAGVGRAQLAVATRRYGEVVADNMVANAVAAGCGAVTGYGTVAQANDVASRCVYGANQVQSLGDVLDAGDVLGEGSSGSPVPCPQQGYSPDGLPGPACYYVPGLAQELSAGITFQWGFSGGAPTCSQLSDGATVSTVPDSLLATSSVSWADRSGTTWTERASRVEPVPGALTAAWAAGGLGAIAVEVTGAAGPVPVGLVPPSWSQAASPPPGPVMLAEPQGGGGYCAVFAFVPAGSGWQVWAGSPSNLSGTFAVTAGEWAVESLPSS
jgi:hypothetical protein